VPENWVEIEGDSCVMKRDYDATELSVGGGRSCDRGVRGKRLGLGDNCYRRQII